MLGYYSMTTNSTGLGNEYGLIRLDDPVDYIHPIWLVLMNSDFVK